MSPEPSYLPTSDAIMKLPGQLDPTPRLLLGPGPGDVHPRVLRVMATPLLGHLDPQFKAVSALVQERMKQL